MDRSSILVSRLNKSVNIFSKCNKSAILCLSSARLVGPWNACLKGDVTISKFVPYVNSETQRIYVPNCFFPSHLIHVISNEVE